jgi:hypothetical protein
MNLFDSIWSDHSAAGAAGLSYLEKDALLKAFKGQCEVVTLAINGFRLKLAVCDGVLVSIFPNARSVRGGLHLTRNADGYGVISILGRSYSFDRWGSRKLADAIYQAFTAWELVGGDIEALYAAIGQSGRCAICGASLTDPQSMSRGIGPECFKKIWVGRRGIRAVQQVRLEQAGLL